MHAYEIKKNISYYSNPQDKYQIERCKLDLYLPSSKNFKTIVWFHGGGLTSGEKNFPENLMKERLAIIAVNYRLSPKVKVQKCIEDSAAAIAWVYRNIEIYGGNKKQFFISGHSAGGYLTMMATMAPQYLKPYGLCVMNFKALIPLSGHTITHFTAREELKLKDTDVIVDSQAPLHFINQKLPPIYLITGDRDLEMLGRYEENAYMWRMLKITGHKETYLKELPGHDHGNMVDPGTVIVADYVLSFD